MNLDSIFKPQSIAVIGASTKVGSVGNDVVRNLVQQGYLGDIYPVNPKTNHLYGKYCYKSILDIEEYVELAVVVVPAVVTPKVIAEALQKGVRGVVVISAGFKEVGNVDLEDEITSMCKEAGVTLIGPNCLGVITPEMHMNASFAPILPKEGAVAFLSQSGALCSAVLDYAKQLHIGFSKFASMGNKAIVDEVEMLEYFNNDPQTEVVALYVEELRDAEGFIRSVRQLQSGKVPKPVIVLKSGRTKAGASASASHTGALTGNDIAYDALFEQSGALRARDVSELFDYVQAFSNNPVPESSRVAIVTNAGGPGVLTTDKVIACGLEMAEFMPATNAKLKSFLPPAAAWRNPVDVLGDALSDRYQKAIKTVVSDEQVDSVIVVLTPQSMTESVKTAQAIITARDNSKKPIFASFMGFESVSEAIELMRKDGISVNHFPERSANALAGLARFQRILSEGKEDMFVFDDVDRNVVKEILSECAKKQITDIDSFLANKILEAYGIATVKIERASSASEARKHVASLDSKAVLKISSPDIFHKSDVGGIALKVTPETAEKEYTELLKRVKKNVPKAEIEGVLVVEMVNHEGVEMLVGAKRDPLLGPVILAGLGGIYVEALRDVAYALSPLSQQDVERMIKKLRSYQILTGARNQSIKDVGAFQEVIGRVSQLFMDHEEFDELDINPLYVRNEGAGVIALDVRIRLRLDGKNM